MRLAIFGATGKAGRALLELALAAGHEVTVLVRTPDRLTTQSPRLTVLRGDVRDRESVRATVAGADAVLSTLGGSGRHDPDVLRAGTESMIGAMREAGVRRLIALGGFHLRFPGDPVNFGQKLIVPLLRTTKNLVEDTTGMAELIVASDLDWTVVRIPRLTRGHSAARPRIGTLRLGPWNRVSTQSTAALMLDCATEEAHVRAAPMICDPH